MNGTKIRLVQTIGALGDIETHQQALNEVVGYELERGFQVASSVTTVTQTSLPQIPGFLTTTNVVLAPSGV